jgi:inorganic phosphate transporter, PiT family
MALLLVLTAAGFVAFANGQNDVAKGVATLVGSRVTGYRRALLWGTLWTGLGCLAAVYAATAMIGTFGQGLLAPGTQPTSAAAVAALLAAGTWVALATRTSLPVSTTHALVGGITGAGLVSYGATGIEWSTIGHKMALPLLVGPIAAAGAAAVVFALAFRRGQPAPTCVCVSATPALLPAPGGTVAFAPRASVTVGPMAACAAHPAVARVTIDHLHWLSSGAASFARGLNDAPKIAALGLAATVLTGTTISRGLWFAVVTIAMVAGSLLAGRRIARVLAEQVTCLDPERGFTANLVTAGMVGAGALYGLPLSTTHVSTGTIIGTGLEPGGGRVAWRTVGVLGLAWVITVPIAAVLACVYAVILA